MTPPPPALPPTHPATSPTHRDTVQPTESRYLVEGGGGGGGHQKQAHASEPLNIYSGPQVPAVKVKQQSGLPPGGGSRAEGDQKTTDLSVVLSASLSLFFPIPPALHVSLSLSLCTGRRRSQAAELLPSIYFPQICFPGPAYKMETLFIVVVVGDDDQNLQPSLHNSLSRCCCCRHLHHHLHGRHKLTLNRHRCGNHRQDLLSPLLATNGGGVVVVFICSRTRREMMNVADTKLTPLSR